MISRDYAVQKLCIIHISFYDANVIGPEYDIIEM